MSSGVYSLSSGVYTVVGNGYVTAYDNGMLPLMQPLWVTELSYPTQYATTVGNRLGKRKGTV